MPKAGGKRNGAGRPRMPPALKKEPVNVKLPRWIVEWTAAQDESRAVLIETALTSRYKLKPPA